jgi:hypothetical protein
MNLVHTFLQTSVSGFEDFAVLGSCGWHILMFFTLFGIYQSEVNRCYVKKDMLDDNRI